MRNLADEVVKTIADITVGTVIVLVHVALADRLQARRAAEERAESRDLSTDGAARPRRRGPRSAAPPAGARGAARDLERWARDPARRASG